MVWRTGVRGDDRDVVHLRALKPQFDLKNTLHSKYAYKLAMAPHTDTHATLRGSRTAGATPASSAHDAAAALALGRLSHRLAAQVDVDHEHRRVVLEPPEPGRRALRSPRCRRLAAGPSTHTPGRVEKAWAASQKAAAKTQTQNALCIPGSKWRSHVVTQDQIKYGVRRSLLYTRYRIPG